MAVSANTEKRGEPLGKEDLKESAQTHELSLCSDLGDITSIDFEKFEPEMYKIDRIAKGEIVSHFNPDEQGVLYLVGGATPHLLPAAVEAGKLGLACRGIARGKHLDDYSSEKRTVGVARSLGIKSTEELEKLFQEPISRKSSIALFLLEPPTHQTTRPLMDVYRDVLAQIGSGIAKIVLISESLNPKTPQKLKRIARSGGGFPDKKPYDMLANWCHEREVQLEAYGFYMGVRYREEI